LLTMQSERGLLPCVWMIPGHHVSRSEDTCRAPPRLSSSLSHSSAKLESSQAPLALAPRMIASLEAESIEHTALTRGHVSAFMSLSYDTATHCRVSYCCLFGCAQFISRVVWQSASSRFAILSRILSPSPYSTRYSTFVLIAQPRGGRGQRSRKVRL
jgi:hypothetical protein